MSAPAGISFESFGVRLRVIADTPEMLERIPSVLPPDARPCPEAEEKFAVLKDEDGRYRLTSAGSPVSSAELDDTLTLLETQLQMYIALHAPNRIFVHAGVVAHDGRAIVIPGRSLTGKSTLVLALVRAGAVYYSDEFAVIDERGLVHPYAAPLWLREPPPPRYYDLEHFQGRQGSDPLRIGAVVVTSYQAGAEWRPTRLSPGQGVLAMVDNALTALTRPREAVNFTMRAINGATVLQGDRGEADDVARELLHTAWPPAILERPAEAVRPLSR